MSYDEEELPTGYRSPPVATRFKPGQSGNPRGRPRKARSAAPSIEGLSEVDTIALKIANQEVTVRDGEGTATITMLEAALRAEAVGAAKGKRLDRRDMLARQERIATQRQAEKIEDYEDWSLIKKFHQRELERGVSRLPHPDDISLRPGLEVAIIGPLNSAELASVESWVHIRDLFGLQAVFDLHWILKRMSTAERSGLLPISLLLMHWIDGRLPKRFRLGAGGIGAAENAHIWLSRPDLADAIKSERRALRLDPGGRVGPMKFATFAQAEKILGSSSERNA